MKRWIFQESKIFEAGDPPDPSRSPITIKSKDETRARKQLPPTSIGRRWLLISVEAK